jgi:hypothetical protein
MSYPMTSVSRKEYVMRYTPPPPPPVDVSITFNIKFQWNTLEKDLIVNALEILISSTAFMKRFPAGINQLRIQVITSFHKDKVQDRLDHINCCFYWDTINGETNRDVKCDTSHLYFNETHSKIWQITETKYTTERY